MNGHPLVHHLLPLCVLGKIAGSLIGASPVADANVIVKTPKGFERYLSGNARVTLGVEMHRTANGHDRAATLRRRRIDDGPPIRIAEERQRHLIPPFVERLALGGLSGWLWAMGVTAPAAILCAGAVLIIAIGYLAASRKDVDGTTEVAALVVVAAGVLAGLDFIRVASGIFAGTTLLLVEKSRLHALAQRTDDVGLRSGVRFAAMALVILPLLPEGPYGPFGGVRPRELWAPATGRLFSGISSPTRSDL